MADAQPVAAAAQPASAGAAATPAAAPVGKPTDTLATAAPAAAAATTKPADAAPAPAKPVVDAKAFKLPDGAQVDAKQVEAFAAFASESGLTQAQAQAVLERDLAAGKAAHEAQTAAVEATRKQWATEALADKALADQSGTKLSPAVVEHVNKGLDWAERAGVAGLRPMLENTGLGNHPVAIRLFRALGAALSEDKPPLAGPGIANRDAAEVLFSSSKG